MHYLTKIIETSDKNGVHVPLEVKPANVILGWKEALLLMQEVSAPHFTIPHAYIYIYI